MYRGPFPQREWMRGRIRLIKLLFRISIRLDQLPVRISIRLDQLPVRFPNRAKLMVSQRQAGSPHWPISITCIR